MVAVAVLTLAALLGFAPAAFAHATLVSSDPPSGAALDRSPQEIVLVFDEPVTIVEGTSAVADAAGRRYDDGRVGYSPDRTRVTIGVRPDLARGTYLATWRYLSADTHVIGGSVLFGVGEQPVFDSATAPGTTPDSGADPGLGPVTVVARWLVTAGTVLLAGAGLVLAWFRRLGRAGGWAGTRRAGLLLWLGWWVLLIGSLAELVVRFLDVGDAALATATPAIGTVLRAAGLLGAAALLVRSQAGRPRSFARLVPDGRSGLAPVATVAVVLAFSIAVQGHAAAGPDSAVALVSVTLHVLAMAVWLGGLVLLAFAAPPGEVLPEWSRVAAVAVAAVVVTGVYQAVRAISPLDALWGSGYGRLLLAKIVLVGIALFAAAGARRLVPAGAPAHYDRPATGPALRRRVLVEVIAGVVVLAASATLSTAAPPQTDQPPAASASTSGS